MKINFYFLLLLLSAGCSAGGDASPTTAPTRIGRSGQVIVLRGFMGIWSRGMDRLTDRLRADGLDTRIIGYDDEPAIADELIAHRSSPSSKSPAPLVLIGHSYGADGCLLLAQRLAERRIPVDLVITVECVTPIAVPDNVEREVNIFKPRPLDFLPWWRGVPVRVVDPRRTQLEQIDVHASRPDIDRPDLGHSDIDKDPKVLELMEQKVLSICPLPPERDNR